MKKLACLVLPLVLSSPAFAGDFTGELQWLTMVTACIGQYNMAQTGDYTVKDPQDYYRPGHIREWLARQSGSRTLTQTFYGVCFDYAQWAYDAIARDRSRYEGLGMKKNGWYIAVVKDNPGQIILYDPVSENNHTDILNGVPLKEISRQNVRNHGGTTTWHAWLWVYGNDGAVYWLDPTWTDNTGYVWWGVVRDGGEVQVRPAEEYCMVRLPNNAAFADFNKGYANYQNEMSELSIADYTAVLRNDPGNALAYSYRGVAYADMGDYDQGLADCNQAVNLAPNLAYVYYNRGLVYYYVSDKNYYNYAIADYTRAISLDPNFTLAYYQRGIMYAAKGDLDKAIADHSQAIRLNPGFADAYSSRGSAYRRKGDFNRAIADIETALRINPNDAFTKTLLEMVRRDRGY